MAGYHTIPDVRALAERLDQYFLGYHFDFLMPEGQRSALAKGKGTRNQTFRRHLLDYVLREVLEVDEILVSRALNKDRSSIREGVKSIRDLLVSENWGAGLCEISDLALRMETMRQTIYARHDEPRDVDLRGWRASAAAWAFFLASRTIRLKDPERAEYVSDRYLEEIREEESAARGRRADVQSYGSVRKANRARDTEAARLMRDFMEEMRGLQAPDPNPHVAAPRAMIEVSHPALRTIQRNLDKISSLKPLVCTDEPEPGDYFSWAKVEPNLLATRGERLRVVTKASKDALADAMPVIADVLCHEGFRASKIFGPEPRAHGGFYALLPFRAEPSAH